MAQADVPILVRIAKEADQSFIRSLSPVLAAQAKLDWHSDKAIQKFQDAYIAEMMTETSLAHVTYIAENEGVSVGFIHVREHIDEISSEKCGTVPLLAITESAQGMGAGKALMEAAETWAKNQGFRLLHLEVFSSNAQARSFYQKLAFKEDTINMVKHLD